MSFVKVSKITIIHHKTGVSKLSWERTTTIIAGWFEGRTLENHSKYYI